MLGNWLTTSVRVLLRHRLFVVISVVGLSVGLAAALMIAGYVRHQLGYDGIFTHADRIHGIVMVQKIPGRDPEPTPVLSLPLGEALAREFPAELQELVQVSGFTASVRLDGEPIYQSMTIASPGFFRLFDHQFLQGSPANALDQPWSVVLTESTARKLFRDAEAMGSTLTLTGGETLTVTGIVRDPPSNISVSFQAVVSLASPFPSVKRLRDSWGDNWLATYALLAPGVDARALPDRFQEMVKRVVPNYREEGGPGFSYTLQVMPLQDLNLDPKLGVGTSRTSLAAFSLIGALLLATAAINFVNLSTARAGLRSREVALRKTLGASRTALTIQFLGESVLLALLAGVVAIALVELCQSAFHEALGVRMSAGHTSMALQIAMAVPMVVLVGLAAGFYPARVLSGFRPVVVLRGGNTGVGGSRLRTLLVVVQFSIAIALIVGTLVVQAQVHHASTQRLGFDRENVLLLRGVDRGGDSGRWLTLKERLRTEPGVVAAAGASWVPADPSERTSGFRLPGDPPDQITILRTEPIDFGYLETLAVPLLAGRHFDESRATDQIPADAYEDDKTHVGPPVGTIVSESVVSRFSWGTPEQALGRTVIMGGNELSVIGVVSDLQFSSARNPKVPTVFIVERGNIATLVVRIAPGMAPTVLDRIAVIWRELYPDVPLRRQFLDDRIEQLYADELRQGQVFAGLAGLTVAISCLGLFGLATFTVQRRTKEIGIRKIFGAKTTDILRLIVWQFSRPVLVANLIAWPLAWTLLSRWLEGYASRVALDPLIFMAAGAGTLMLAWITVAGHAARVARTRPVTALRYE